MAEDKPLTPEQQLLKLIESQKGSAAPGAKAPEAKAAVSFPAFLGMLAGRLSFWRRALQTRPRVSGLSLTALNRVLALVTVGLLVYVSYDAFASAMTMMKTPNITINEQNAPKPVKAVSDIVPLKESSFYLDKIEARDIFKEGQRAAPVSKTVEREPEIRQADISDDFSLVGISWSSSPDVIIENKREQRTYFVKRGQPVGEGAKVEAVFKDHVVLSRDGQEYELR